MAIVTIETQSRVTAVRRVNSEWVVNFAYYFYAAFYPTLVVLLDIMMFALRLMV
jgi:hypothetical protein